VSPVSIMTGWQTGYPLEVAVTLPDIPHIARPLGVEPAEGFAADRAVGSPVSRVTCGGSGVLSACSAGT